MKVFKTGVLARGGEEYEIKRNKLTMVSYFSVGSIKYTGKLNGAVDSKE